MRIPGRDAVILTNILVAPTINVDTVQQSRETLDRRADRSSIVVAEVEEQGFYRKDKPYML